MYVPNDRNNNALQDASTSTADPPPVPNVQQPNVFALPTIPENELLQQSNDPHHEIFNPLVSESTELYQTVCTATEEDQPMLAPQAVDHSVAGNAIEPPIIIQQPVIPPNVPPLEPVQTLISQEIGFPKMMVDLVADSNNDVLIVFEELNVQDSLQAVSKPFVTSPCASVPTMRYVLALPPQAVR